MLQMPVSPVNAMLHRVSTLVTCDDLTRRLSCSHPELQTETSFAPQPPTSASLKMRHLHLSSLCMIHH